MEYFKSGIMPVNRTMIRWTILYLFSRTFFMTLEKESACISDIIRSFLVAIWSLFLVQEIWWKPSCDMTKVTLIKEERRSSTPNLHRGPYVFIENPHVKEWSIYPREEWKESKDNIGVVIERVEKSAAAVMIWKLTIVVVEMATAASILATSSIRSCSLRNVFYSALSALPDGYAKDPHLPSWVYATEERPHRGKGGSNRKLS